jgi:hypothetical protein
VRNIPIYKHENTFFEGKKEFTNSEFYEVAIERKKS